MLNRIRLDIDIINIQFEYSDMNTLSDVEYLDLIRTDLNPSKRIRSRIRSENICTVFTLNLVKGERPSKGATREVEWKP
jgi:hypothetical protein